MRPYFPPAELLKHRSPISALRTTEQLFASAGLGVWHLELRAGRLWWSEHTIAIHETDPQLAQSLAAALDFYLPEARTQISAAIEKAMADGTSWDLTLPLRTARGREIMLRSCGLALIEDGEAVYLLGTCEDLTEAYRRSQEHGRLAIVVEQMTNAAVIADREGKTVWVNAAFEKLTGYSFHDLCGKTPGSVLQGPDTNLATVRRIKQALAWGRHFRGEILNYGQGGNPYWIELEISPIRDPAGELTGFVAIESDVTARREARANAARELATRQEAETLLQDIINAVPTAISAYDRHNRLLVVDQMQREAFPKHIASLEPGIAMEQVFRGWDGIEEQTPEAAGTVDDRVGMLVAASRVGIPPFETKLSDGRWLLSAAWRSESGNLIWVRTDISDVKRAELAAREQARRDPLTGLLNRSGFFEGF